MVEAEFYYSTALVHLCQKDFPHPAKFLTIIASGLSYNKHRCVCVRNGRSPEVYQPLGQMLLLSLGDGGGCDRQLGLPVTSVASEVA